MLAKLTFARAALFEDLRVAVPAEGLAPLLHVMLAEGPTLLLSSIAGLDWHLADLAEDDLCGLPLGVVWPWPAEVPLCALLLKAIHEVVPPPPLSPDPGVSDGRAGATKDQ